MCLVYMPLVIKPVESKVDFQPSVTIPVISCNTVVVMVQRLAQAMSSGYMLQIADLHYYL